MHFNRIRMIGLALVAVFAMSVLAASAASAAAPEFKPGFGCSEVEAGGEGNYGTKVECETPGNKETVGGKWHRHAKFTAKNKTGVKSVLKAVGNTVTCETNETKAGTKGEITGAKTVVGVIIVFKKCIAENSKKETCPAKSPVPGTAETIETKTLHGELGLVEKAEAVSERGEDLLPPTGSNFTEIEGTCIVKTTVTGSVIGEVKPVKVKQSTGELVYKCFSTHVQEIEKFVGVAKDVLTAFGSEACFQTEDTVTFGEALEVT